jgi:hypothetical protein
MKSRPATVSFRAALLGVAAVALCSCQSRVGTVVDARGDDVSVRVEVRFEGEGLQVEEAQQQRLMDLLQTRSGSKAHRSADGLSFWVEMPLQDVPKHAAVTGVQAVSVSSESGRTRVQAAFAAPSELIAAVSEGVQQQQDADALLSAALGSTEVGVTVRMGTIDEATFRDPQGQPQQLAHEAGEVEWYFPLSEIRLGTLDVSGRVGEPNGVNVRLLALSLLLLGGVGVSILRRRS